MHRRVLYLGLAVAAFAGQANSLCLAQQPAGIRATLGPPVAATQSEPVPLPAAIPPPEIGRRFVPPPPIPPVPRDLQYLEQTPEPEAAPPLSLAALEASALQNNPTLRQAQEHIRGQLGKAIEAGLWPNPVVGYVAEQIGVKGTAGEFQGAFVRQEIVTARKREISREKYLERARVAEWLALAQQYRALNDVRIHFFRALGRQGIVDVQQELLKNAEDVLKTTREMYNVGQATLAEVHQANALLQRQRVERLMAENDLRQTRAVLASLVGIPELSGTLTGDLEGEVCLIDWQAALQRLMAESPEIQAAHAKLRQDQITLQRELVEPIPNIFVQGAVGRNLAEKETVAAAQVFFEVPIFDRNQGTILQARADLSRQVGEIRRTELDLQRRLSIEYRRYLTALQHVQNFRAVVLPEARKAYEIRLQSYREDRIAWPLVLDAEREYQRLRLQYFTQLIEWREAEVLINGLLLHDGLRAAPDPIPPAHIDVNPQPR